MELLVTLFVGQPPAILTVAVGFLAGYLALRFRWPSVARHPRALLFGAMGWGIFAGWEWLVLIRTPEANIRVDLLVIGPVLLLLSAWSLLRAFR